MKASEASKILGKALFTTNCWRLFFESVTTITTLKDADEVLSHAAEEIGEATKNIIDICDYIIDSNDTRLFDIDRGLWTIRDNVFDLMKKWEQMGCDITPKINHVEKKFIYTESSQIYNNFFVILNNIREAAKITGTTIPPYKPLGDDTPQKDLHYYCKKAIEKGYLIKLDDGYKKTSKWTKAQLVYFLSHFGVVSDKVHGPMFHEQRPNKAWSQLLNNKTTGGKPRGYTIVDELLKE